MAHIPGLAILAPQRPSLTVVEPSARKADRRTALADLQDELTARRAEAIDLMDGLGPLVSYLIAATSHLGPREYQTALTVQDRLARFRRQQVPG